MPELPEVETVRRQLERALAGRSIRGFTLYWPRLMRDGSAEGAPARLAGARVRRVRRRGKHLLIEVSGDWTLLSHLGMSGGYRIQRAGARHPRHTLAALALDRGESLLYVDSRRFGRMRLVPTAEASRAAEIASLGPDPLESDFTPAALARALRTRRAIKDCLLDQRRVAGIGNIYACEALHRARLHPWTPGGEVGGYGVLALHREIGRVLREAIAARGTTFRSFSGVDGERGGFVGRLLVYGREGEPCAGCGAPIARRMHAGRSTWFCPSCQGPS